MTNEQAKRAAEIVKQVTALGQELQALIQPTQEEWDRAEEDVENTAVNDLLAIDALITVLEMRNADDAEVNS